MKRHIDAYSLQLLVTAAQEGSITRAAAKEHIAPSALSRRIADLEEAIGAPLLVRSPRGITLTEAGHLTTALATRIEGDLEALVRQIQALSGEIAGTVRLFANPSSVVGFLPERLKRFAAQYPHVDVALSEGSSMEIVRACLDDRADLGIGVNIQIPAGIESWHFADDPLLVVLPAGHVLAKKKSLRFAEVLAYPLISIHIGGTLDLLLHERAAAASRTPKFAVSVSSFDAACRMVEAGLGITVLPESAASAYAGANRFVRRLLDEPWAGRELRLFALRKTPRPRVVDALIDVLQG
ncbi:LysR family transcriptional regulator [Glaciimonas sp. CA11.2]|uniref:LysR family transcriptional regulator n=1 Tax=Glaciimonas sp. CA11.2 TaxID=3048601 RepID=UPI002AB5490D|nr:LysR family transcriptional regulator [Glaciimonas sp. CA11.2]MDY7545115.1 LysR family transcriptional regulator [Glaciimonas sp. CA11.2]MEB0162838.1 LysR family transcriptional regulator [Glaciimonas sp. CA11.2]